MPDSRFSSRALVLLAFSLGSLLAAGWVTGCASSTTDTSSSARHAPPAHDTTAALPAPRADKATDYPGLHNLVVFGDGIVSGSQPEGPKGFASLKGLGFKTIVSVDGAEPDLDAAKAQGLRYVHLPIGYNGASPERQAEIARAIRDLPGPVYVHCHHGKHRSAAAAASASLLLARTDKDHALSAMKVAGTSPSYTGLWACVDIAMAQPVGTVDRASNAFPEVSRPKGIARSMIEIDAKFDQLKLVQANGWAVPTDHPDLVPAADAGVIADLYRVSADDRTTVAKHAAGFEDHLRKACENMTKLEEALARKAGKAELEPLFKTVKTDCTACHTAYRDLEEPE
ncbi:MAG: cytochrome c [Phycisphaerae bacterium]|nr:cytochrome c [Phycisphaerae bacterium]